MRWLKCFLFFGFISFLFSCEDEESLIDSPWKYAHPLDHEVSSKSLLELDVDLQKGTYGKVNSLIIIKDNEVIFENYYNGTKRDDLQPINGATMSITSAVAGIALDETDNLDLNSLVIDYFPEYSKHFEDIPQKDKINFKNLLNLRSGLWWDEEDYGFYDEDNEARIMLDEDDWIDYILSHKMIRVPGQYFNYNSGNAVLAGAMVEKAVNTPLREYANEKLFKPLSIKNWEWDADANDITNAAFGLKMRACDLAKIGYLYLDRGNWGPDNIISNEWIEQSINIDVALLSYNFSKYWWQVSGAHFLANNLAVNDMFFAWGEGGQFLFIIPHLEMVIVTTADNYVGNTELYAFQFMADYILPAVTNTTVTVK